MVGIELTQKVVRKLLDYNPRTGELRRRTNGRLFGCANKKEHGRRAGWILGNYCFASRVIWLWMTGSWPTGEVDHDDRDPSNNRWYNLKDVTKAENLLNKALYLTNKIRYTRSFPKN